MVPFDLPDRLKGLSSIDGTLVVTVVLEVHFFGVGVKVEKCTEAPWCYKYVHAAGEQHNTKQLPKFLTLEPALQIFLTLPG